MANTSILQAFERLWQHVVAGLDEKVSKNDIPKEELATKADIDSLLASIAEIKNYLGIE